VTLTFLNPTSTVQVDAVPAFPVGALTGTRVALIDNSKENAGYLLGVVGQRLVERFGVELVTHRKRVASEPLAADALDEIARTCGLVLTGLGD
jgi:hypothetical protein